MPNGEYLRTRTISKRVCGVLVTVMRTGDKRTGATTVKLSQGENVANTIELFADSMAEVAKATKEMLAVLEVEDD